jgi:hypothetical protein
MFASHMRPACSLSLGTVLACRLRHRLESGLAVVPTAAGNSRGLKDPGFATEPSPIPGTPCSKRQLLQIQGLLSPDRLKFRLNFESGSQCSRMDSGVWKSSATRRIGHSSYPTMRRAFTLKVTYRTAIDYRYRRRRNSNSHCLIFLRFFPSNQNSPLTLWVQQ